MEALKAELRRKKNEANEDKRLIEGQQLVDSTTGPSASKFIRKSQLNAVRRQRIEDIETGQSMSNEKLAPKPTDTTTLNAETSSGNRKAASAPLPGKNDIISRLRRYSQPIIKFGETVADMFDRLTRVELSRLDDDEVMNSSQFGGSRDDWKDAMRSKDESVHYEENIRNQRSSSNTNNSVSYSSDNRSSDVVDPTTIQEKIAEKSKYDVTFPSQFSTTCTYDSLLEDIKKTGLKDSQLEDMQVIANFIKVILRMWADHLNERRSEDEKSVLKGRTESGIYTQTVSYMSPLMRMLRKQTVSDDKRDSLLKMVKHALNRDYIKCSEAYMEMAVGNAPWPIGVTNAGIHARPARENIHSKHVAHVLNDETQRKYIQGLKRCITKAQLFYPTDPSKSIDFSKREV